MALADSYEVTFFSQFFVCFSLVVCLFVCQTTWKGTLTSSQKQRFHLTRTLDRSLHTFIPHPLQPAFPDSWALSLVSLLIRPLLCGPPLTSPPLGIQKAKLKPTCPKCWSCSVARPEQSLCHLAFPQPSVTSHSCSGHLYVYGLFHAGMIFIGTYSLLMIDLTFYIPLTQLW